jgi:hypothetical protein
MSKTSKPSEAPAAKRPTSNLMVVMVVVVILVNGGLLLRYGLAPKSADKPAAGAAAPAKPAGATATDGGTNAVDHSKLLGKWVRPDGGYVIEIRDIDAQGRMTAAYFNPRPINVSTANVKMEGSYTKLFIELRDENYPGSTYTLIYLEDKDQMVGMYFQAAQNQSFEVEFERLKN